MVASGQQCFLTLMTTMFVWGPESRGRGSRVHLEVCTYGESLAIWDSPVRVDPHCGWSQPHLSGCLSAAPSLLRQSPQ